MNLWLWHSACYPMLVNIYMKFMKIFWKVIKRTGPSAVVQARDLVILKPTPPAFIFRNWETKFQCFDAFDRGFIKADKLFKLDSCLTWSMGVKSSQMCFQNKISPRLEIVARWGPVPISMVLRSERSLKLKMLSLTRTSKVVNNTSV